MMLKMQVTNKRDTAERKAKLQKLQLSLEDDILHLVDENTDLLMAIREVENELVSECVSCSERNENVAGMKEFALKQNVEGGTPLPFANSTTCY